MREAVLEIISSPNPSLASTIEGICEELEGVDWFGLIPKLWPNAKYVYSIMTGSMQPYLKKLRHYAKGLPLVSGDYGSTESWIGVNVDPSSPPESVTFAVVPTFSYFEFIPLYRHKHSCDISSGANDDFVEDKPIPLSKVKVGQEYEIALTTFTAATLLNLSISGCRPLLPTPHLLKGITHLPRVDLAAAVLASRRLIDQRHSSLHASPQSSLPSPLIEVRRPHLKSDD
ncbi:hypothetical protein PIB30_001089 [Stylosanthes scabra]|uniref:GH3 middle domain-containing protein n=1 Tax=Stylosanthes scabra TaxID=79078 RepID=A0ABU6U567_9FABA|nr:hypothetical protein [Stylosanthes scabra]